MAFSDKDVLAARKLVSFGFLTQIAASIVQAIAFSTYIRRDKIPCQSSTTHQSSSQHYSAAYWIYLAFRIAASVFPCEVAYRLTSSLNKIENKNNATRSARVKATALWRSLPATLATSYLIYWSFVLLHGLSIVNILRGTNTIEQSWHSLISEWGQSANAIIAIVAICHVAYAIWRLFTAESVDERAQTATPSGLPISQAYPQPTWKTWKPWVWIMHRWPFHLGLDYSDHLLVDESMVERVLKPPLIIDPIARKKLWQDLMDGFTYNDPDGIIDCLDQGAPLDEPNDDGDYPIHLAARHNNIDILVKTRFNFTRDSTEDDPLLLKNLATETPLEVACNANTIEAVRWIMEHLPQTHTKAKDAVSQAFKIAILGEKQGILRILQHLWPEWRALRIQTESRQDSLLSFAIDKRKAKSAYRLTDLETLERKRPHARRIFELCWKSKLSGGRTAHILDDRFSERKDYHGPLINSVIASSSVDNAEALELLSALNIDILAVFRQSITYSVGRDILHDERRSMWEYILQEGYNFETKDLDSIITFELTLRKKVTMSLMQTLNNTDPCFEHSDRFRIHQKLDDRVEELKTRIREALIYRGGRDWSEVVTASRSEATSRLEELITAERDPTMLQRMLNVEGNESCPLLAYTHRRDLDDLGTGRIECIDILLKHGRQVTKLDLVYAYDCSFRRPNGNIRAFMILAAYAKTGVASDMLCHVCCTSRLTPMIHTFVQILLRCGANPILTDENGKTPRDALEDVKDMVGEFRSPELEALPPSVRRKRPKRKTRVPVPEVMDLLQRWEDYYNDPQIGKPSERPDEDWKAVRDDLGDEASWAWLVEKNPEGYKVVED